MTLKSQASRHAFATPDAFLGPIPGRRKPNRMMLSVKLVAV